MDITTKPGHISTELELPKPNDGPGRIIALKAIAHARAGGYEVWVRSAGEMRFRLHRAAGRALGDRQNTVSPGDPARARARRDAMHGAARDLVTKAGLGTGDEIAFYGGQRYGKYLCERLETLGCLVEKPLAGLNNGQRLGWLTAAGF